ncbi:MAG: preprotein translocase subunit YajC [Nitrospiraceae bacterium]|nr:MAG: preprotein translocase subunit YajC [Nitrospiraceae bacterium]
MFTDIAFAMGGAPGGGAGAPQGIGGILTSFFPLILIFVIFYFLLIRPQSKKAKEHRQMLDNLKKGDKVVTTGGIFGVIEELDEKTMTLQIGVKGVDVRVKVDRNSVSMKRTGE